MITIVETGKAVQQHMRSGERAAWWVLVIFTCGIAYPFYRHRRNSLARTTRFYA